MTKKFLRLGMTETSLLFFYWYQKNISQNNKRINDGKHALIKWLYTTSGYYDKTIKSNYMDATHNKNDTIIYNKYMENLLNFIKNADNFNYGVHYDTNTNEFKKFIEYLGAKNNNYMDKEYIFNLFENNNVLIVSPFAKLFEKQYESANIEKIYNEYKKPNKMYFYTNIYTFFNKGPHNNIFETCDFLYQDIKKNINDDYNLVIVSAGAYSNILLEKFYNDGKDTCSIGGELQKIFGVLNNREKNWGTKTKHPEYWITEIPEEFKPKDYMKIEDGCYW